MHEIRCPICNHKLGMIKGIAELKCRKCGTIIHVETEKEVKIKIIARKIRVS